MVGRSCTTRKRLYRHGTDFELLGELFLVSQETADE